MSEEEFFNRLINKIDKEFGYDVANTLQLMFIKKEKQVEQLEKEIDRLNKLLDETRLSELHKEYIINELEKWIKENNLGEYRTENVVDTDELLDKLKALKENK